MPSAEQNKQTVREFFDLLNADPLDLKAVARYVDPAFESQRSTMRVHGRDVWLREFEEQFTNSGLRYEPRQMMADDSNQVWTFGIVHMPAKLRFLDPALQQRESVDIFTLNEKGQIAKHFDVQQTASKRKVLIDS